MKVAVTGDFHGYAPPEIPECDLLLFVGDLGTGERFGVKGWSYAKWLASLAMPVVGVAGNHDFDSNTFHDLPWHYLENDWTIVTPFRDERQLKVWGSPLSVTFRTWAHMKSDEALANVYAGIPDDTEIILSHGPPYGYGDLVQGVNRTGSRSLYERCRELPNLKLLACGHIHEDYGIHRVPTSPIHRDIRYTVVNGSYVDERYKPGNPPIVVEL